MTINQNLVPSSKYSLKCPHSMTPQFLCVHNTASDASAKNEISYMVTNTNATSFHFAVDDKEIWQGLPLNRNGWHAGDGNGDGNRKSIGIEICYSKSGGQRFIDAEKLSAKLVAKLLKDYGWGIDRVKKHQDFSGKNCPGKTLELGWDRYLGLVNQELKGEPIMTTLHVYLGTANDTESKTRLKEHLGENNGKCDWGNEADGRGGHLGSERRKTKALNEQLFNQNSAYKLLADELSKCQNKPPQIIREEVPIEVIKEVPIEIIKEQVVEREIYIKTPPEEIGALSLLSHVFRAIIAGRWS